MSDIPSELMFTTSHEWLRAEGEGVYTIGITDHAQRMLGDAVVVNLPEVGASINAGEECALVESVKAVSDIFSPISGEIIAVNDEVRDMPELINSDPYGDAWLFQVVINSNEELTELLDAEAYQLLIEDED